LDYKPRCRVLTVRGKRPLIAALGIFGGLLLLVGLILPWYPAGGRFVFSGFTLMINRQFGPLLLHVFLLIFGAFAMIGGGLTASVLRPRDSLKVFLAGAVSSVLGVIMLVSSLTAGFNLTNPLPGVYVFTQSPTSLQGILEDMAYGFYVSVLGIASCICAAVLCIGAEGRRRKRR
jgi:hypothetical protein